MELHIIFGEVNPTMVATIELFEQIMQRPYPSPSIIMELISRKFPTLTQLETYKLSQRIRQTIAEQDTICSLAKQNKSNN